MNNALIDLKLFVKIDQKMQLISPEDIKEMRSGKPAPDGAAIIGELSPALKTLLCVYERDNAKVTQMCREIKTKFVHDKESEQYKTSLNELKRVVEGVRHINTLFRLVMETEFPDHEGSLGYTQDYKVYQLVPCTQK